MKIVTLEIKHTKKLAFGIISAIAMAAAISGNARADTLWTNPITGTNPNSANPYTAGQTVLANITVTGIGRGTGSTGTSANDRYNANSWDTATMDANAYFTFTLDANTGFQINFTSFTYSGQASGTGPTTFAFRSSADGFVSSIGTPTATGTTINLSAAAYQNLTNPIEFRLYAWGASGSGGTFSVNDFTFNGTVTSLPTPNNSILSNPSPSSVAFGRVMQNATPSQAVSLTKAGSDTTTYTATPSNNGLTITADGAAAAGSGTEPLTVALANNANGSSVTGTKSYTVTVDNLATTGTTGTGSNDPNDTINVSATVLANRDITVTGSGTSAANPVNLGKVFVGAITGTSTISLSGGAADDNNGTRVNISGSTISGGITAAYANGADNTFNSANETKTVSVSGTFATSGAGKTGTINAAALLTNGEAAGVGATADTVATINYTADVYQRADLSTSNNATVLDAGGTVSVSNSNTTDGGQRAAAQVASKTVSGDGWSVSGLDIGTNISQNSSAAGTANFDSVGKLNGMHVGTLVLGFQYSDTNIRGAGAATELADRTWNFTHTVTGNVSDSGTATVGAGGNYANFGLTSTNNTSATLLSGTNASGSASDVTMSFSSSEPTAINDIDRVSDVFNLTGTDESIVVLQLSYDEANLGSIDESTLRLGWLSGDTWVLAIDGNSPGSTPTFVLGAWNSSYGLGAYGVDINSNTVWAVIDHNSEFTVVAVPEPGTYALLTLGGMVLVIFRRRQATASL